MELTGVLVQLELLAQQVLTGVLVLLAQQVLTGVLVQQDQVEAQLE